MQRNANGLMEPSPLIAALIQALVKCCRLATTFLDWKCSGFSSSPPQRSSPLASQAFLSLPRIIACFTQALSWKQTSSFNDPPIRRRLCCSYLAPLMLHFALLKVYLSAKRAALGREPGPSPRFPVPHHLCTRQNLTRVITMKASTKEESLGVDQEVKNDGWKTDNEAGLSDWAKLGVWVAQVALLP